MQIIQRKTITASGFDTMIKKLNQIREVFRRFFTKMLLHFGYVIQL